MFSVEGISAVHGGEEVNSIRYSPEVLNYFKSFGVGWQARMDAALKEYVANHPLCDREEA